MITGEDLVLLLHFCECILLGCVKKEDTEPNTELQVDVQYTPGLSFIKNFKPSHHF